MRIHPGGERLHQHSRHRLQGGAGRPRGELGQGEGLAAGGGNLPGGHERQRGAAAGDGLLGRAQGIAREAELHPSHVERLIHRTDLTIRPVVARPAVNFARAAPLLSQSRQDFARLVEALLAGDRVGAAELGADDGERASPAATTGKAKELLITGPKRRSRRR